MSHLNRPFRMVTIELRLKPKDSLRCVVSFIFPVVLVQMCSILRKTLNFSSFLNQFLNVFGLLLCNGDALLDEVGVHGLSSRLHHVTKVELPAIF